MVNYVDVITDNIMLLIPGCNKIWATSNALGLIQTMMHNYELWDDYGPVKANDYFCILGASGGALKSIVPIVSTIPILKRVNAELPCLQEVLDDDEKVETEKKSIFLPDTGSSEGLNSLMAKNNQTWGIIDQDEISKFCQESRGKGYKSGDMEFLCRLYDSRGTRSATTSRGEEYVEDPYIVLLGSSTQHFIKGLHDGSFFRLGLGNRFVWSYVRPEDCIVEKKSATFFDTTKEGNKKRFLWHNDVVEHLLKIYSPKPRKMYIHPEAVDVWLNYDLESQTRWKKEHVKDVCGWEYGPINRLPMHVLKTAMTFCMAESSRTQKGMEMGLERPPISLDNIQKAIVFVEDAEHAFNEIVNWKILYTGISTPRKDYTDLAKHKYAKLRKETNKILFFSTDFFGQIDAETDYEYRQVVKALKEMKYIKMVKKTELTPAELKAIDWPDSRSFNTVKAVKLLH